MDARMVWLPRLVLQHRRKGFDVAMCMMAVWQTRRRYRADLQRLLQLAPYLLDDIGIIRNEAIEESCKPFWIP